MSAVLERAIEHHRRGELNQAEALYRKILKACPGEPDSLHLLGCIALKRNRRAEAIRLMRKAVEIAPGTPLYHENLAEAYHRDGQKAAAQAECRLALRADPARPAALNRLGVLAMEQGEYDQARAHLSEALGVNPVYGEALINLGAVLVRCGEFELARESCELALKVEPENPLAWNNLGLAWKGMGRREQAAEAFNRAGNLPMSLFNLGYLHLLDDNLETGLTLCETRKRLVDPGRGLSGREWNGRSQPRKRLLVTHEQGLGDTILMSRFFSRLRDHFAEVTVLVQPPLVRLLKGLDPGITLTADLKGVGYDRWCGTMSLPFLLGIKDVREIPVEPWLGRAPAAHPNGTLRIGVNWAGNPSFLFDRTRSMSLETLAGLLEVPGVEWISLHKGNREEEAESYGLPQPLREARDFADTAAVLAGLDLVISTETAVPNLSAAMGIPTCVLAAADYDWRWRSWFSGVTICDQDAAGDWSGSVAKAAGVVKTMLEAREQELTPRV